MPQTTSKFQKSKIKKIIYHLHVPHGLVGNSALYYPHSRSWSLCGTLLITVPMGKRVVASAQQHLKVLTVSHTHHCLKQVTLSCLTSSQMPRKRAELEILSELHADVHRCLHPIFYSKPLVEKRKTFKITRMHLSDTVCENLSSIILVGCVDAWSEIGFLLNSGQTWLVK